MNKFFTPFFTRLYGSLFLAIFTSVFLTFVILEKWNEHDATEDFVTGTLFFKNILEVQRQASKIEPSIFYSIIDNHLYPFDIEWLGTKAISLSCNDCIYLNNHNNVDVYELENGELLSIHLVPNTSDKLIIKDKSQGPELLGFEPPQAFFDIEGYSIVILLFVIVVVIGLVLYLPIRKLQKEINHLNLISYQLGKGNLKVRASNSLSEPLTILAKSFNKMADALSNKVNESQVFAQAVPHELRTPLSRIQLVTGILRNKNLTTDQTSLVDNIDQYIGDIDELCSQIIQFSKLNIQTDKNDDEEVNLNNFIAYRISKLILNPRIPVVVNFTAIITVNCKAANLRLIIDNMLKNAVSHAKSNVTINVNRVETMLEMTIEDDGHGIPEQDYDTIFIPYARLDNSRTRKTGGLGMGLAITKGAVNQLGGEINVSSSPSGGARFKITLPILK
ncbi:sensor histidine kinase [Psychromonas hadalis]|uniref:sensor histidine kinase n=1 Tax=Psychromonas hadalis TaxID=211669 RepID=UPI0003B52282|nr:HAMP domain-containing sensor histidine kinase [Psychromonas hadalis]